MSDQRLPPETFYWGLLDAGSLPPTPPGSPKRRVQLGYLFESVLPHPIESVHAAYLPVGGGTMLACGIGHDTLQAYREEGWTTLGPASLPDVARLQELEIDPRSINLLFGPFESPVVRGQRRRWVAHLAAACVLIAGLLFVGVERRIVQARNEASAYRALTHAVYERVLPPAGPNAQPDEARFLSEVRTLERTRATPADDAAIPDMIPSIANVFARWPAGLQAQTHALSVGPDTVTLTTIVPNNETAQQLITDLGDLGGWNVTQNSVTSTNDGVQLRRAWSRVGGTP